MANTTITKILLRRGPEIDRESIIPTMGEPLFTTDTHRLYIGDGETYGGRPVIEVNDDWFTWQRVDPTTGNIVDLPTGSNGTDHHVLSFNPNLSADLKTSGRIITTNTGKGCSSDYNSGAALIVENGGIYCGDNINCKKDIISFCSSDAKFKDDVKPIDDALDRINKLNGVTFKWNDKQQTYTGEDTGVIAQDVQKADLPGVVQTRESGDLAVKYEKIVPLLIEGIKQLSKKVNELEDRLNGGK